MPQRERHALVIKRTPVTLGKLRAKETHRTAEDSGTFLLQRWRADLAAVLLLVLLTTIAEWDLLARGTMIGQDAAIFFYPMFSYLGRSLRSGDIPLWNPWHFSGAPFAADPQSGWMYLPAMALFTVLPLVYAAKSYMFLHLLGAGLAVYALARTLRINVPGALMAGISYGFSGFLFERHVCCFAYSGVMVWLPIAILCSELAIRSSSWAHRGFWCGLSGLAVSQILASWLGQGSYYALLALGGYIGYRALLAPPSNISGIRGRTVTAAACGLGVLIFGFGLAAAGLIPRLEYNSLSSLSSGYPGTQVAVHSGWSVEQWRNLLHRYNWYAGVVALMLSVVAPFVARARYATPYWLMLATGALVLTGQGPTPLHTLLYLLPGFKHLHPHDPERIVMVFILGTSLLAGAAVSRLSEQRWSVPFWMVLAPVIALIVFATDRYSLHTVLAFGLAGLCLTAYTLGLKHRHIVSGLLLLVTFADLLSAGHQAVWRGPGQFRQVDLRDYYSPRESGQYLLEQGGDGSFRYFGYDPKIQWGPARFDPTIPDTGIPYRFQWSQPIVAALLVNNRGVVMGLEDVQGYNPIHIARYDEFMQALNGYPQEYRGSYVFVDGLLSPLLPLLNARYIIIPAKPPAGRADLQYLVANYETVHQDGSVRVLLNPRALPRAWLTHDARQGSLDLFTSRVVDPAKTVLLEREPPPLGRESAGDSASVVGYEPERIEIRVRAASDAMLVLSEVYYPAWRAYVDGKPTDLYVANHAFRAVKVSEGEHTVVLQYESTSLRLGMLVSALFCVLLLVFAIMALRRRRTIANTVS